MKKNNRPYTRVLHAGLRAALLAFAVTLCSAAGVYAGSSSLVAPVEVKNTHILYITHLFMPVESSALPQGGQNSINLCAIISNTNYMFEENGKEGNFDIETKAALFTYSRRINESTEVRVQLPLYYNSGGFMDEIIETFHEALPFSVKNGGREYVNDNEIHIWYNRDGGGPDINSPFYGAGDPSLFIKKIFYNNAFGLSGCIGIKPWFGTKKFINSNTTDAGFTFNANYSKWIFTFFGMGGFTYFFGSGIYREELEQDRDWMALFALGAGIRICDSVYAAVQFYCNTSPYRTGVERMDNITVLNSWAVRWQPSESLIIQFSFDEDTFTYVTADIAFSLRCGYIF